MNKLRMILALALCCVFLGACGERSNEEDFSSGETVEYMDIVTETEQKLAAKDRVGQSLGKQFYQQEPVELYSQDDSGVANGLYIRREGGSSELLLQGVTWSGRYGYVGLNGCIYLWNSEVFVKMDQSGETVYKTLLKELNLSVQDICQLEDGRLFLLIYDNADGTNSSGPKLAEMDADTGEITQVNTISKDDLSTISVGGIAAGPDGLMIMTTEGVWTLDVESGSKSSIISFVGSSYILKNDTRSFKVEDFRVTAEGKLEILRLNGDVETIQEADVSNEYVPITLRGIKLTKNVIGNWLKERIVQFNQENGNYYVVIEECDSQTDPADYARLTSVEISTGKGPDIICGPILDEYISGMIEKGAFEDLSPYLKKSSVKEEDYFPGAFNCWRDGDKIYGVNFITKLNNYHVAEKVLGNREVPDIETLVDALLAWEEKAVYMEGYESADVLRHFLEGSDELWGMVDWEKDTCDFEGELFGKLLEVAKRYGDKDGNGYEAVAVRRLCEGFFSFDSQASQVATGKVSSGVLFDDGCYGVVRTDWTMAVNANSAHKEGVWEFISYLLSEDAQVALDDAALPVHRGAFQTLADEDPDPNVRVYRNGVEIAKANESEVEEMLTIIENAKPLPIRTVPILDIVCEEAGDYFEGTKSIEEVVAVIENRVQLYLEEHE